MFVRAPSCFRLPFFFLPLPFFLPGGVGIDFGTPEQQNKRALHALLDWLSIAMVSTTLTPSSPVEGPELLRSTDYVGTAQLPEGFTARWDGKTLCVDGSVNGSPVQHATNGSYDEPGGIFSLYDGPCPS